MPDFIILRQKHTLIGAGGIVSDSACALWYGVFSDGFLSGGNFCFQLLQPVQRFQQRFILLGKVEADQVVHRLPEEAGTANSAHAYCV